MIDKPRLCACCGLRLERKYYNERLEDLTAFKKRKFCSLSCANTRTAAGKKAKRELIKSQPEEKPAKVENLSPLEFMLRVMRDEKQPARRRDSMAIAAAKYVHYRGMGGKKEERAAAAEKASSGKFSTGRVPKIIPLRKT